MDNKLEIFVTKWIEYCRDHLPSEVLLGSVDQPSSFISIYCKSVLIGIFDTTPSLISTLLQKSQIFILNTDTNCYHTHKKELQLWKIIQRHLLSMCEFSHPEEKYLLQNYINMLQSSESIYQDMLIKASHVRYCPHPSHLISSLPVYHGSIQNVLDTYSESYKTKNPSRIIDFWDPYFTMITVYNVKCPLAAANILIHIKKGTADTKQKLEKITHQIDIDQWCSIFIAEKIITLHGDHYVYDSTRQNPITIKYQTHFTTWESESTLKTNTDTPHCLLEQNQRTYANLTAYIKTNPMLATSQILEKIPHATRTHLEQLLDKGILTTQKNTKSDFSALKWKLDD
jgi:hypothetical protein